MTEAAPPAATAKRWWPTSSFVAGILAGSVSAVLCTPLDVLKVRVQVLGTISPSVASHYDSIAHSVRYIIKNEGYTGLWSGYSTAAITVPLFWSLYFPTYKKIGSLLGPADDPASLSAVARHGCAALGAAFVADVVTNPLFVVRTRLMTQGIHQGINTRRSYSGPLNALLTITRTEGVLALWKGLSASLIGASHAVIQFPVYELLKVKMVDVERRRGRGDARAPVSEHELSATSIMFASALSKTIASAVTFPHEVVRARLQDSTDVSSANQGLARTARAIYREHGMAGMYAGFNINLVRTIPATVITFFVYEKVIQNWDSVLAKF